MNALKRLKHWQRVLASWQLGSTRSHTDPELEALRDHREATLVLQAEVSALVKLLISEGFITQQQFDAQVELEAAAAAKRLERRFPGFKAGDDGITTHPTIANDTMREWRK